MRLPWRLRELTAAVQTAALAARCSRVVRMGSCACGTCARHAPCRAVNPVDYTAPPPLLPLDDAARPPLLPWTTLLVLPSALCPLPLCPLPLCSLPTGAVRLWDVRQRSVAMETRVHTGAVNDLLAHRSADSSTPLVITAGADHLVTVLDPRMSLQAAHCFSDHRDHLYSLTAVGDYVVSGHVAHVPRGSYTARVHAPRHPVPSSH
jgi:hypothetical protein